MKLQRIAAGLTLSCVALLALWAAPWAGSTPQETPIDAIAPDFSGADRWYNSAPLTLDTLRGKVALVEFWTRECVNCIHVLPHTKALYDAYSKRGLVVIGVHTPEYAEERDPQALQDALRRYGIMWPVAVDNESRIWNAYGNRYWPAVYLIDRNGRVVYRHYGEGAYEQTEQRVRELLGKA